MKIVTILGKGVKTSLEQRAEYRFDTKLGSLFSLKKMNYTNMLPLLIDNFDENIIPIFTKEAKSSQLEVLKDEFAQDYAHLFSDNCFIEDEKDFYALLRLMNEHIAAEEEYIIDLTHGFRHIPILATISIITHNIKDTSNIKHIFFAKEIVPRKEYEIIDLKEYIELANMSYILETFIDNYTVSTNASFSNEMFQELSDELRIFSSHILSNSLIYLFDTNHLAKLLKHIDTVLAHKEVATFKDSLLDIKLHIQDLIALDQHPDHEKYFKLSIILNKRGYLLNSITLLFEAIGHYCVYSFAQFNPLVKKHIQRFKSFPDTLDTYRLTQDTRTFIKNPSVFKGSYLFNPETVEFSPEKIKKLQNAGNIPRARINEIHQIIRSRLDKIAALKEFQQFIFEAEALRNNLAHGNSGFEITNVQQALLKLIKSFELLCIQNDILKRSV